MYVRGRAQVDGVRVKGRVRSAECRHHAKNQLRPHTMLPHKNGLYFGVAVPPPSLLVVSRTFLPGNQTGLHQLAPCWTRTRPRHRAHSLAGHRCRHTRLFLDHLRPIPSTRLFRWDGCIQEATAEESTTGQFHHALPGKRSLAKTAKERVSRRIPHSPVTSSCKPIANRSSPAMLKMSSVFLRGERKESPQSKVYRKVAPQSPRWSRLILSNFAMLDGHTHQPSRRSRRH